ncbi:MAG: hypothetical protein ACREQM_02750 [Candidatus Dormibacteraceae bacterium]
MSSEGRSAGPDVFSSPAMIQTAGPTMQTMATVQRSQKSQSWTVRKPVPRRSGGREPDSRFATTT